MKSFPDESLMERSPESNEPIRGGSIGLNNILGRFVTRAPNDRKPEFNAVLISAFTIFRNVVSTYKDADLNKLEEVFVKDVNLFLDYYDTYLSFTKSVLQGGKFCPVVIYFPDYRWVEKDIRREWTGRNAELHDKYSKFLARYNGRDELVRKLDHVQCFWIRAGDATYPHKEVARKFRDMVSHPSSAYSPGDSIALISHIPLDFHIASRLRGIHLLESHTAELKSVDQLRMRLDKEGRIPFNTTTHVVFGDPILIKPWVTPKVRKQLFEMAIKDRWLSRTEEDIKVKIAKAADIPLTQLRKFDFV